MLLHRILSYFDPEQVLSLKLNRVKNPSTNFASELSEDKLNFITQNTTKKGRILEFGAGGSTLELLRRGFDVTSIESDRYFAKKLNNVAMKEFGLKPVVWNNIGLTGNYGYPASRLFFLNLALGRFRNYVNQVRRNEYDTVIIDGRFRIATFLNAAIQFQNSSTLIVIDDYLNRPEYHVLEKIFQFDGTIGVMAYYFSTSIIDQNAAENLLNLHIRDPR